MRLDVIDLRDFYAKPLGEVVQRLLTRQITSLWPDLSDLDVAGLGYTSPFLEPYKDKAARVLNLMPAAQGVMRWPSDGGSCTALIEETSLPFPDASLDRLLLVHCLENSETVRPMLREIWRVLSASGRLLVITPNRRGLWSRLDTTPFGHGRPFSRRQLTDLLRDTQFTPTNWNKALFLPPFSAQAFTGSAGAWENVGERLWPRFSGLLMAEASKQIYALSTDKPRLRVLRPVAVASPAVNKSPKT